MDFAALYTKHCGSVFQLALRLLGDKEMAADAVQETFAKAFAARAAFRGESAPGTWLYRIAYNTCLSKLAEKRPHEPLEGHDRPDAPTSRPERTAEAADISARVRAALARLDEDDRRVLCLQMDEALGYEELAAVLGCAEEAARMRVCRARRRLRELLGPLPEGDR